MVPLSASAICLTALLGLGGGLRAEEAPNADLVEMIVNLVSDKDRDTRSLGLQQVRDEAKGPAATKQFAALLPKLPPDSQAGLLDALGGRGDRTARPAVLPMVKSEDVAVRVAALRALGPLGEAADVPLLARQLTAAGPEKTAAREALVRLSGPEVRAAIVAEVRRATPEARAELLGVLGARKDREALPVVLQYAGDKDATVRLAALTALRGLAGQDQAATLVLVLKAAKDDQEQWQAEQALLAVCGHDRETWVPAILAGMADAGPSARAALLRVLARSHGAKALAAIVAAARDAQPEVSKEALRLLANWPDAAAVPPLRAIAREAKSLRENVVAVQGLIHMASPVKDKPADVDLLVEAMKLARRSQEKQMASSILQAAADSKDPQIRERAQKALQTLGRP